MSIIKNFPRWGLVVTIMFWFWLSTVTAASNNDADFSSQKFLEKEAAIIEPGVLPNSFWYWVDIFAEQIQYLIVVGKENKGDFLIERAAERLAEMKKLSEGGITKHLEDLIAKNEEYLKKAEALYQDVKNKSLVELQGSQTELEKEILRQEAYLKKQAKQAPQEYDKGQQKIITEVGKWFKNILKHLSWKRIKIKEQKAEMWE